MARAAGIKWRCHSKMAKQPKRPKRTKEAPGPKPDRLVIEGDWREAVRDALTKKRPKRGWPKPPGHRGK